MNFLFNKFIKGFEEFLAPFFGPLVGVDFLKKKVKAFGMHHSLNCGNGGRRNFKGIFNIFVTSPPL